jgi:membrane-bound metal-dependent hydrolase YbcI (DUF457 family)
MTLQTPRHPAHPIPEVLEARRRRPGRLAFTLVGFVLGLDLLWSLVASSTATTEFAAVDEPAHLATGLLLLLALLTLVRSRRPSLSFIAAAAVASVALDLDHLPGLLGWHGLTAGVPRPYTHSLATPIALVVVGELARGRLRPIAFGAAFGVCAHLFRDLCTGPGLALFWPVSTGAVRLPYLVFALGLVLTAGAVVAASRRRPSPSTRPRGWREAPLSSRLLPGVLAATVCAALALAPARAAAAPVALGAYIPNADQNPSLIDRYAKRVGRAPVIISSYARWRSQPFARKELRAVWKRGAVPMVTWEPWTLGGRGFSLKAIVHGRYDRYARRAAKRAAAWGRPILLRFAHEMNGNWYPWGMGRDGNTPRIYKAAWRHLVRIFHSAGAGNVRWMWTPNVNGGGNYPFAKYYPGDRWVDWVGLDGFNWAKRGQWQSFTDLFGSSYNSLARLTSRPMIIAETGSSQSGGSKAAWVSSALSRELPRFSRIRGVVWFSDEVSGVDFRVDSSRASLKAFRSAIASPLYGLTRHALLSTPAHLRRRAVAPPPPSGGFGQPSLLYRLIHKLHGRYLWIAIACLAAFVVAAALALFFVIRARRARRAAGPRPAGTGPAGPARGP